jgi:hypothetical protein
VLLRKCSATVLWMIRRCEELAVMQSRKQPTINLHHEEREEHEELQMKQPELTTTLITTAPSWDVGTANSRIVLTILFQ